jgi:hypothetical protein
VTDPPLFTADDLEVLARAIPLAEELVGDHFRVTSFGPHQRLYEVVTLASSGPECRAPHALARLCRFDRQERPIDAAPRVSRFYRICIQDDAVLTRARDELDLRAILLYVLTHELIHIVRFESFEVGYDAAIKARVAEEGVVDRLTREVLSTLRDRTVDAVVEGLSPVRVDVLAAGE